MSDDSTPSEIGSSLALNPTVAQVEAHLPARAAAVAANTRRGQVVSPASCPTCAAGLTEAAGPPTFESTRLAWCEPVFRRPRLKKEFAQVIAAESNASLTHQAVLHKTLKENRYLANEVCWVFSVEGVETYILFPRDSSLLD